MLILGLNNAHITSEFMAGDELVHFARVSA